ncbi:MAG: hypothetical protein ABL934_09415 [Lysobacteraceae bacterium]
MRQTPDAVANIVMTTNHLRPVPSISRDNADRAVTTPPPSAIVAAKAFPTTTLVPPRNAASEADQPIARNINATSTTAANWQATARNAALRPAAIEFSTRHPE